MTNIKLGICPIGWTMVEAEQDPAIANPLEYAQKARKYIHEVSGL